MLRKTLYEQGEWAHLTFEISETYDFNTGLFSKELSVW
jgi:hypothetical protein